MHVKQLYVISDFFRWLYTCLPAGLASTPTCGSHSGRRDLTLPIGVGREDFDAQLDEREEELAAFERHLALYQAHLLRKSLSGTITSAMLEVLKTSPDRIHIIADYKQKWLPLKHLETQQDAFGKRGKSIYGLTAFRWDAVAGEFSVLNVRVAADDSGQNWYHTLNVTATAVDIVLEAWPNTTDASFQADGAGNFTSTATLISLPRTFASRGIKIRRAVISEVGDGKNLVDTDFQQVQMALSQRIASGANVETAQDILDNLEANPTAGTANAAIDLAGRADEPGKAAMPKPLAGIDALYDREYEYDEATGAWTGCVLRQFFKQGEGKRMSAAALRGLWKQHEPQLTLQPTRLQPSGGSTRAVAPKVKPSEEGSTAARLGFAAERAGVTCSVHNSEFGVLGSPERRCVWFLSVTFQKAQIRSHTPRNIDRVPREKTRKNTVRSH